MPHNNFIEIINKIIPKIHRWTLLLAIICPRNFNLFIGNYWFDISVRWSWANEFETLAFVKINFNVLRQKNLLFWQEIINVDINLSIVYNIYVMIFILRKSRQKQAWNFEISLQFSGIFLAFNENLVQILDNFNIWFNLVQNPKFLILVWRIYFEVPLKTDF